MQERCKFSGWLKVAKLCNLQMQRKLQTQWMASHAETRSFVGFSLHCKIFTFGVFNTFLFWHLFQVAKLSDVERNFKWWFKARFTCLYLFLFLLANRHMKQLKMRWKNFVRQGLPIYGSFYDFYMPLGFMTLVSLLEKKPQPTEYSMNCSF